VHAPIPRLVLGYLIKDRLGQEIYGTNTHFKKLPQSDVRLGEEITYSFTFPMNLGAGSYSITTALTSTDTYCVNNYEWRDIALVFTVINMGDDFFIGCVLLNPQIQIQRS
jgi:lipopolysaccharide transport system ATP-binding protein